jgi:predicted hydrolase (HD superfamily)
VFVPQKFYANYLSRKNRLSVLWAALLGVPLPLCSCGVIPTAIGLRNEKASKGAIASFLIATPQTGIDSILATFSLMGLGFADKVDFWGMVGLLHDIDFELYPEEHCIKAPKLLREGGVGEDMIHAICSHGYGHVDVKPEHLMEKVLFTTDELTGLIWAAALMRPSKSVQDMELKSLKKKYKSKGFAAGCSREVIEHGAEMLGWPLDEVLQKTLDAMRDCESRVANEMEMI